MDLDEQIEYMDRSAAWVPSPMRQSILASLRELKRLREALTTIYAKSKKPYRDSGHRCEYRVQLEAIEQSARAALKESPDGQ